MSALQHPVVAHGWSLFLPFHLPAAGVARLRRGIDFAGPGRVSDLHDHVSDYLVGAGGNPTLRWTLPGEPARVSLAWEGARDEADRAPFEARVVSTEAVIFPDGIGFLISVIEMAEAAPTLRRFLQTNNRARVLEQAAAAALRARFDALLVPLGAAALIDERLPTHAYVAIDEGTAPAAAHQALETAGAFFWPGISQRAEGEEGLPEGTLALASNLWLLASQRGAVFMMVDDGGYARRRFPKNAAGRWRELYLLALHERFALAALAASVRRLAMTSSGVGARLAFSKRLGQLRRQHLDYTALHRFRDVSADERCQSIHSHFVDALQIDVGEEAQDRALAALDELAGHAYRERMGQVGMIVSAVLFPLSLMSMLLGMNVEELTPGAATSLGEAAVWLPLGGTYLLYLGALSFILYRR